MFCEPGCLQSLLAEFPAIPPARFSGLGSGSGQPSCLHGQNTDSYAADSVVCQNHLPQLPRPRCCKSVGPRTLRGSYRLARAAAIRKMTLFQRHMEGMEVVREKQRGKNKSGRRIPDCKPQGNYEQASGSPRKALGVGPSEDESGLKVRVGESSSANDPLLRMGPGFAIQKDIDPASVRL